MESNEKESSLSFERVVVPFPTALFSEYFWSRAAFVLYAAPFLVAPSPCLL